MKKLSFIILIFSLFSCKPEHKFNLDKDLYQFSEKMENGDTVKIKTNLSACTYFAFEEYTFTKQNNTLFVEKYSEVEDRKQTSSKIIYKIKSSDPSSFEKYFKYLSKENRFPHENQPPMVSIYYKGNLKNFYANGFADIFTKQDSLAVVRKRLYPNDTFLQIEEPAPLKNKKS